jgi:deoxyadenosine/deoxycytidine kinase
MNIIPAGSRADPAIYRFYQEMKRFFLNTQIFFFLNTQKTSIIQTGHYKSVKFPTHLGNKLNFGSV